MGPRLKVAFAALIIALAWHGVARTQQNPYRLKETDQRKLCVDCHSDFQQTLKKRFVHTAVQNGECSSCHSPHASSHGKLLSADPGRICATCHDDVVPAKARSVHTIVTEGGCAKCHDPHASDHAANLVASGSELCYGCHQDLAAAITGARFKHAPVEKGCLTCHDPHGSDQADHLLKTSGPALCVSCHKPDSPAFVARHMKYPVARASCTTCHDPHGSGQPALLLTNVHQPVGNRTCAVCHEAADSASPFATKQAGFELCRGCHNEMVTATLAKGRLHWPVADKASCGNCHSPHASKHEKLLKSDTAALCSTCHVDTARKIATATVQHAPVREGMCVSCHSPHSANGVFLVDQPTVNELCMSCHDYNQHSSHPLGDKVVDPRNPNLRVDCLSCHTGHGTDYKWMLLAPTNVETCTPCHQQFSR